MVVGLLAWTFLGFMLAQALGVVIIIVLKWAGVPLYALGETFFTTVTNIVVYALALTIVIGVPWKLKKRATSLKEVGLHTGPKFIDLGWLVGGATVYIVLAGLITAVSMYLLPNVDYQQAQNTGFSVLGTRWEYILAFVSLVLVAPVAEEVLFRGYLLGKVRKYAPNWLAVIVTAALFAVAHGQFNVGLDTFALGVVLALLRIYSGRLWPSIFLHMLKNGVAFYFLFLAPLFV